MSTPKSLPTEDPAIANYSGKWLRECSAYLKYPSDRVNAFRIQRVTTAATFLRSVSRSIPLETRINFLRYKELTNDEIEDAFEQAGLHSELMKILTGAFTYDDYDHGTPRLSDSELRRQAIPFREEDPVLRYSIANNAYYPAVIRAIDDTRHEDMFYTEFVPELPPGELPERALFWMASGFKEIVANLLPPPGTVKLHDPVLCRNPTLPADATQYYVDAMIVAVNESGGNPTYDVYSPVGEQSQTWTAVPLENLRALKHPKRKIDEKEIQEVRIKEAIQKSRITAALGYPILGLRERPPQTREIMALMKGITDVRSVTTLTAEEEVGGEEFPPQPTEDEQHYFGVSIRSFLRYPALDVLDCLPHLQDYAAFLQVAGSTSDPSPELPPGAFPITLPSTADVPPSLPPMVEGMLAAYPTQLQPPTSKGFGFDLSAFRRHPYCPHLFEYNPVLALGLQCIQQGRMYVDPDFPPTYYSLYGSTSTEATNDDMSEISIDSGTSGSEAPRGEGGTERGFEWRRLSELKPRQPILAPGSPANAINTPIVMGAFTSQWLPVAFALAAQGTEFEQTFSPSEAACKLGFYCVRLFVDGRWYFVVVDDFIPVYKASGTFATLSFKEEHCSELWPILLEKVYAKLTGSYAGLRQPQLGFLPERVFEDLSGGLSHRDIYSLCDGELQQQWFTNLLGRYENREFVASVAIAPQDVAYTEESKLERMGIEVGSYHLVKHVVQFNEEKVTLGKQIPDEHHQWVVTTDRCSTLPVDGPHREAILASCQPWMRAELDLLCKGDSKALPLPYSHHLAAFPSCLSCYHFRNWFRVALPPHTFRGESSSRWLYNNERWAENPQYYLSMISAGHVAAQFKLCDRRFTEDEALHQCPIHMLLSLMKAEKFETPLRDPTSERTMITSNAANFQDRFARESASVYLHYWVEPGGYLLVPEIGCRDVPLTYVVTIWSTSKFEVRLCNDSTLVPTV